MKPDVSVVIPTFDNWDLTRACLESLRVHVLGNRDVQVIVVDNGSRDETPARLASYDWVEPVLLPRNLGFAAASNLGALQARADLLFFLNNDTVFASDALAPLCEAMARDEDLVIAGSRLLYDDGSIQHAGLVALAPDRELWHVHRHLDGDYAQALIESEPLAVTGAAMLVRRSWFLSAGGFDTAYANGYEDADLCLKAWADARRVKYAPRSVLYHLEGATSGRTARERQNRELFRSRWDDVLRAVPLYERAELRAVDFTGDLTSPTPDAECGLELLVSLRRHVPVRLVGRREETLRKRPDLAPCYAMEHLPQCTVGWLCVPQTSGMRIAIVGELTDLSGADEQTVFFAVSASAAARVRGVYPNAQVSALRVGVDTAGYAPQTGKRLVDAPFEALYYVSESSTADAVAAVASAVADLHRAGAGIGLAILSPLTSDALAEKCAALGDVPADLPLNILSIADLQGFVNASVLCGADAVLLPETTDETPFFCLAVMSAARPIAASKTFADEGLLGAETARICESMNDMRDALQAVLNDPRAAARMGALARAHAVRRFSASIMGDRTAERIRHLCTTRLEMAPL